MSARSRAEERRGKEGRGGESRGEESRGEQRRAEERRGEQRRGEQRREEQRRAGRAEEGHTTLSFTDSLSIAAGAEGNPYDKIEKRGCVYQHKDVRVGLRRSSSSLTSDGVMR